MIFCVFKVMVLSAVGSRYLLLSFDIFNVMHYVSSRLGLSCWSVLYHSWYGATSPPKLSRISFVICADLMRFLSGGACVLLTSYWALPPCHIYRFFSACVSLLWTSWLGCSAVVSLISHLQNAAVSTVELINIVISEVVSVHGLREIGKNAAWLALASSWLFCTC